MALRNMVAECRPSGASRARRPSNDKARKNQILILLTVEIILVKLSYVLAPADKDEL